MDLCDKINEINKLSGGELIKKLQGTKFTEKTFMYMNLILGNRDYCEWLMINYPQPLKNDYFKARLLANYFECKDEGKYEIINNLRIELFESYKKVKK